MTSAWWSLQRVWTSAVPHVTCSPIGLVNVNSLCGVVKIKSTLYIVCMKLLYFVKLEHSYSYNVCVHMGPENSASKICSTNKCFWTEGHLLLVRSVCLCVLEKKREKQRHDKKVCECG